MSMRFISHSLRSLVLHSHAASSWNEVCLIGAHVSLSEGPKCQRLICASALLPQVGNLTQDIKFWGPPENMTAANMKRPAYVVRTADGASDLSGSMVGALASTALAWQKYGNDSAYVDRLMKGATALYMDAKKYEGSYTARFKCAPLLSVRSSLCHLPVLAAGVVTCWPA